MPSILIIEKNCDIKPLKLKTFVEEDLYKKCNFKSAAGFSRKAVWQVLGAGGAAAHTIELYGKTEGRANHENKYEFPPPADNMLFFGSCILVKRTCDGEVIDITPQDWEKYYSQFHGGFEELGSDDSVDDDDEVEENLSLTKDGYEKDGFVVDEDDTDAEEPPPPQPEPVKRGRKKGTTGAATPTTTKSRAPRKPRKTAAEISAEVEVALKEEPSASSIYDEEPELSEEEYIV